MATAMPHTQQSGATKAFGQVDADLNCVPEHEATAAQIVRNAIRSCGYTHEEIASSCGISRGKVSHWHQAQCTPGLIHLVRLAVSKPGLVEAICRGLLSLCAPTAHLARPLPERICSVLSEVGDVAREVHMALADGRVDPSERNRILAEIGEARAELDRLERDLG